MEIYDDIVKINWTVYDQKRGGKQLCSSRGMFHACLIIGYFGKPIKHFHDRNDIVFDRIPSLLQDGRPTAGPSLGDKLNIFI